MLTKLVVRLANQQDIENIFALSNNSAVRNMSVHSKKIEWNEHVEWFNKAIQDPNIRFYVAETSGCDFIGRVSFHREKEDWAVSISLVEKYRGKHLAAKILKQAMQASFIRSFKAYVHPQNFPSQKLFLSLGFTPVGEQSINGKNFFLYKYSHVFIIAEMSANHCGDKNLAMEVILKAKEIGADAVKIQTYTADTITINCNNQEFQITDQDSLWRGENLYSLYQKAYTPWEWQKELKQYADNIGVPLFSSPFDFSAIDFLENINVPCYKIASFEAMDYPLIKYAAKQGKPMIISTGVSNLEEIQGAIDACKSVGNSNITLLKCTSAYPAKLEDMNLLTIGDMVERFSSQGCDIGLSDHSLSLVPPIVAVSLGAKVIEKHFTLDRALGGADSAFSLNPTEFKQMVLAVREAEKALGKVDYNINEKNRRGARSIYVVKDIKAGEVFTPENIRSIRPSCGLHPKYYEKILGKKASRDLLFGTPLKLEDIL